MTNRRPFAPHTFTWALGIEDTCIYPPDGGVPLDEHILTEHVDQFQEDLHIVANLGAKALRYGMSWPLTHPSPGRFDWTNIDPVVELAERLGITLVADLVHYGTPTWLPGAFADPAYPDAIAAFAGAVAQRYAGRITAFTPLNEPVTTASFCGLRGVWPPYRTGWEGWVEVLVPMALGIARSAKAIHQAQPDAVIVHVEASTDVVTDDPALDEHVGLLRGLGWLPTDLILGRVDGDHPLYGWLLDHGARPEDLRELCRAPATVDVIGVNYYPDLTPRRVVRLDGAPVQVSYDRGTHGLRESLTQFAGRYNLPLVVTETSIEGTDEQRETWLRDSTQEVAALRDEGWDVRGYTWWPLLDFVDWSWAAGGANVEEFAVAMTTAEGEVVIQPAPPLGTPAEGRTPFLRRMGAVHLAEQSDGTLSRVLTPVAHRYANLSRKRLASLSEGK